MRVMVAAANGRMRLPECQSCPMLLQPMRLHPHAPPPVRVMAGRPRSFLAAGFWRNDGNPPCEPPPVIRSLPGLMWVHSRAVYLFTGGWYMSLPKWHKIIAECDRLLNQSDTDTREA